jgi:hypothetical protein
VREDGIHINATSEANIVLDNPALALLEKRHFAEKLRGRQRQGAME